MSAYFFVTTATGKTAQEAVEKAVRVASHDCGNSGATGTIADKEEPRLVMHKQMPTKEVAEAHATEHEEDGRIDDKWDSAVLCIPVSSEISWKGEITFVFAGWSPC